MKDNGTIIRGLLQDISTILENRNRTTAYEMLTDIVINMETTYNLQDEELIKQLELILKSFK